MESIRAAGGAGNVKLKSAKERKLKKKAEKEAVAAPTSGGGDLMSDLFSKQQMRRKGISGTKGDSSGQSGGDTSTGGGSAMDRISSMIPAPPKAGHSDSVVSNEHDDWGD